MKYRITALICLIWAVLSVQGQGIRPLVAIHDSEYTRALESMLAVPPTPATNSGGTGFQWWPTDWPHYFVMPDSLKEALRSDGTAFTVVGDSNVIAGALLTNGVPVYPIVFSLASEAIRDNEIAAFTNYVAAGGFLFVGSSSFTRNTNGATRSDFAFGNEMGVHMRVGGVTNLSRNNYVYKLTDHRIVSHVPTGQLTWRMPTTSEEISWGTSPDHPYTGAHDIWMVNATDATSLLVGDSAYPFLTIKQYGKGYFIYFSPLQPLIGHGGFAPSTYAYVIFRRSVEWAFEALGLSIPKLSPWPYQYDSAFMVRHDLENFTNEVAGIEASAQFEFTNRASGDYYFCTGTLRDDASPAYDTNAIIAGLRRAVTNYGAVIGSHNGGLKNPGNTNLVRGSYDYFHWGLDEVLDLTPAGYANGKAYAIASLSNSVIDIERWLTNTGNSHGLRAWVAPYFNSTRENSYDAQAQANIRITGDQKIGPFPHWTLSTATANKHYAHLSEPVSDWFVGGLVAQSLEPWHPPGIQTTNTLHDSIDFYYGLGALVNFYSHTLSTGFGDAGGLVPEYVVYCANTNLHPRIWGTNAVGVYDWWLQRSNAQIAVSYATNGYQALTTISVSGATHPGTSVELYLGSNSVCGLQVATNNILAGTNAYRLGIPGQTLKVLVGANITNVVVSYYLQNATTQNLAEAFDSVSAPALPAGWSTSATGGQGNWVTSTTTNSSAPNAAFSACATTAGVNELISPAVLLPIGSSTLSFRNYYDLESGTGTNAFDGGVLEIKIGTNAFADVLGSGGSFSAGGYTSTIVTNRSSPLAGRPCWSGNSGGFITTTLALPATSSGQSVQFRWRCATDSSGAASGWRVDTISVVSTICTCCAAPNRAPILGTQIDRTIAELTPLSVTNAAADTDAPPNTLTYTLINPPAGATISSAGVINWTPSEAQGPSTNTITTVVTDNGFPPMSATNSFTVVVTEVDTPPTLPTIPSRTVNELAALTVTNTATDLDLPPNPLSYTLVNPPAGLTISTNGIITWTPSEAQGPSTNIITTIVNDNGSPPYSATNSFTITVNEVNSAPVLPAQTNRTILSSFALLVTNTATDSDLPVNSLVYNLTNGPVGAVISTNGIISWTPSANHTTNLFRTVVIDNGTPPLSATNSFTVVVNDDPGVTLESSTLVAEGCSPTNNTIDPGETVGVQFALKNTGLGSTTNLVVTLLATNGVLSPSASQNYGALVPGSSSVTRTFQFTGGAACGGALSATLQLQDGGQNLGTITVPFTIGFITNIWQENFDGVSSPSLPAGWTTSSSGAQAVWRTTNSLSASAPNSAYSTDAGNVGVNELVSPPVFIPMAGAQLAFSNFYNLEFDTGTNGFDGGVLEIKVGTNAFIDIISAGGSFVAGGYNCTIDTNWHNPLVGRQAWSGFNTGYISTIVDLPAASAGKTNQFRWRCGTDNGNAAGGWRIDNISVTALACCANYAPLLPAQTNRTVGELAMMIVTNMAIDDPLNSLSYRLTNSPPGATIDTNGVITWTPSESQGPGSYVFTTVANDGVNDVSNSFIVTVTEVNSAPILPVQTNLTIAELAPLTVTNSASDADTPGNTLVYNLVNAPVGALIDTNGVITWTPSETQGPGTYMLTTVVMDNGVPPMSATNSFAVTVNEVNSAPLLPGQTNVTIAELTLLTITNAATDSDIPPNILTYSLVNAPVGALIDTNGVITWTPSEAQGPGAYTLTTVVTDNGVPPMSATNSFAVTVNELNSAPVLPVQTNITITELTALTVTNAATDSDIPANILNYSLVNAPTGAFIDTNGVITWIPSEAQGPGIYTLTTIATDNGVPPLSATNSFAVTVNEVNSAPVLPVQANVTISELTLLTVTNTATDSDIPANTFTYSLVNAPTGALIDTNGVITWTPSEAQGPGSYTLTTVVTDNGVPSMSATNSFTITVTEVNSAPVLPGQQDRVANGSGVTVVTNTASDADLPLNGLSYLLLNSPSGASIDTNGIIRWTAPPASQITSSNLFVTVVTDDGNPPLSATNSFYIVVNASLPAPIILSLTLSNDTGVVTWSSVSGATYKLQSAADFLVASWQDASQPITASNSTTSSTDSLNAAAARFYRVVLLP